MKLLSDKKKYGDFMLHATGLINESLTMAKELRNDGYWVQLKRAGETEVEIYKSLWTKDLESKYGVPRFDEEASKFDLNDLKHSKSRWCPKCDSMVKEPTTVEDTEFENHKLLRYCCPHCKYVFCEGIAV